jgi:hypothetical protein
MRLSLKSAQAKKNRSSSSKQPAPSPKEASNLKEPRGWDLRDSDSTRRRANASGPVGDHRTPAPAGPGVRVAALVQRGPGRRGPGLPPGASAAVRLSDRHCVCNEQDTKHPLRPSGTTLLYHAGTPRIYIFRHGWFKFQPTTEFFVLAKATLLIYQ